MGDSDKTLVKEPTEKSILQMLFYGRIHAKCYKCSKYITFFEVYNGHCSECGNLNFEKIQLVDLMSDNEDDYEDEDEDEDEYEDEGEDEDNED